MNRRRLAIVAACPFPYPRGTPIRIHRKAQTLARRGHDVHVATYHLGDDVRDEPFHTHRIPRVPTYTRTEAGPSWQKLLLCDPLLVRALRRVIREQRVELIHAHHYEGVLAALLARRRRPIPVVFDVHVLLTAELHYYGMGMIRTMKQKVARAFDDRIPRRADHMVTVTDEIRQKLIERHGVDPSRVTAVINGTELEHFDVPRRPATDAGAPKRILFTGNLATYQGVDLMLDAFARVRRTRRDAVLRIVTGSSFTPYEGKAKELGVRDAIEVVEGGFKELPDELAQANVALNPRVEGDGIAMKMLNYMAAGVPVVSFDATAKVLKDGDFGEIVADRDTQAFAAAIGRLLDDPDQAERKGAHAKAYAKVHLSWDRVAEQCEAIYDALLERPAPAHASEAAS